MIKLIQYFNIDNKMLSPEANSENPIKPYPYAFDFIIYVIKNGTLRKLRVLIW